jgi:hypothetical protein
MMGLCRLRRCFTQFVSNRSSSGHILERPETRLQNFSERLNERGCERVVRNLGVGRTTLQWPRRACSSTAKESIAMAFASYSYHAARHSSHLPYPIIFPIPDRQTLVRWLHFCGCCLALPPPPNSQASFSRSALNHESD